MSSSSSSLSNTAPSFAVGNGRFVWSLGGSDELVNAAWLDSAGRILVAGSQGSQAMLSRFNGNGSLDTTFGTSGILTSANTAAFSDVIVLADGTIAAVGGGAAFIFDQFGADGAFTLTRSLDVSTGNDSAVAVLAQGNNLIVVGTAASVTGTDFAVARYTTSGLDTTFGASGRRVVDVSGADIAYAAAVQADGKIVVVGSLQASNTTHTDAAIARFTANGLIDSSTNSPGTSFGSSGKAGLTFGTGNDVARSVAIQSDGRILVGGHAQTVGSSHDFAIARYTATGALDLTFGLAGKATIAVGSGDDQSYAMALQSDGKILLGGYSVNASGNKDFALVRLTTTGALDSSFGTGGRVTTGIMSGSNDTITSLSIQSDGKIVASGHSTSGELNDITLVRYNTDGSVDTTFNPVNTLNATPVYVEGASPVVLDADVQIVDAELTAAGSYSGASVRLQRAGGANADDVFSAANGSQVSALSEGQNVSVGSTVVGTVIQNSAGTLLISFGSLATQSNVNAVLQSLSYSNSSRNPQGTVDIEWLFSDGNSGLQGSGAEANVAGSITVLISSVNDAPEIVVPATAGFADTSLDDSFEPLVGSIQASDPDSTDLRYGVAGGVSDADQITRQGLYGTLVLDRLAGSYVYTPNDAAIEALLSDAVEQFVITVTDGSLQTTAAFDIVLSGEADTPVLLPLDAHTYLDTAQADSFDALTGQVTVQSGSGTGLAYGIAGGADSGDQVLLSDLYGVLSIDRMTGQFDFVPDAAAVNALKGDVQRQFILTASNGRDTQQTLLSVFLDGANDVPDLSRLPSLQVLDTPLDDVFLPITGSLPQIDQEGDLLVYEIVDGLVTGTTSSAVGSYGTLQIDLLTGAYRYLPDEALIESAIADMQDVFTISASDGEATTTQSLVVDIRGQNEAPSFSVGTGVVRFAASAGTDVAHAIAIAPDGKIYVAGTANVAGNDDAALVRFRPDGTTDLTLTGDGFLLDSNGTGTDTARAVALQTDGKIVVAGSSTVSGSSDFAVWRYRADGTPDTGFSGDGKLTTAFAVSGVSDEASAVVLQADGKILVAGSTVVNSVNTLAVDFAVARYNSDGTLDVSGFNAGATNAANRGKLSFDFSSSTDTLHAMALQSDGAIVLVGQTGTGANSAFALARLTSTGALDLSFSADARVTTNVGSGEDVARAVAIDADGRIVVAGWSNSGASNDFAVVRYVPDGTLDISFGTNGVVTTAVGTGRDQAYALAIQSDGKIVVAGTAAFDGNDDIALVRYHTDGTLDTDFGTDGRVVVAVSNGADFASGLAIDAEGRILVAGSSSGAGGVDTTLFRFNADGTPDVSLDPRPSLGGSLAYTEQAAALRLDPDVAVRDREAVLAGSFDQASLTLSRRGGASADDLFVAVGDDRLDVLAEGQDILLDGEIIGFTEQNSAGTLLLRLGAGATPEKTALLMQRIGYANQSDSPESMVVIDWIFADGNPGDDPANSQTTSGSVTVNITALNDLPVIDSSDLSFSLIDTPVDDVHAVVTGQISVFDPDSSDLLFGLRDGVVNGQTITRAGAFGQLSVDAQTGVYTFVPNDVAIESLLADTQDSFTFTVSDGFGTAEATLVVSLFGAADASDLVGDHLELVFFDSESPDLYETVGGIYSAVEGGSDFRIEGAETQGDLSVLRSSFGTLSLHRHTGAYVFTPDRAAIDALSSDASEQFEISAGNPRDSSRSTSILGVVVVGTNDAPVISVPEFSVAETAGDDVFAPVEFEIQVTDAESDPLTFGISGAEQEAGRLIAQGVFGMLMLDTESGRFSYLPDDAAVEALVFDEVDTFVITASDGTVLSEVPLFIELSGVEDRVSFSLTNSLVVRDTLVADTFVPITGQVEASDPYLNLFIPNGFQEGNEWVRDGLYGRFAISTETLAFTYTPFADAIEPLKDSVVEEITLVADNLRDGSPSESVILIAIEGTNDAPDIEFVSDLVLTETSGDDLFLQADGFLVATDRDESDVLEFGIVDGVSQDGVVVREGQFGTLRMDPVSGVYDYHADMARVQALVDSRQDVFELTVSDGSLTTTTALHVDIHGVNDLPESSDFSLAAFLGQSTRIELSRFAFIDRDTGDQLSAIEIVSLPNAGVLKLGDSELTAGRLIDVQSIGLAGLHFDAPSPLSGVDSDGFTFRVLDSAGGVSEEFHTAGITLRNSVPNQLPSGSVTVTGALTVGRTLTANATISDGNGLGELSYVWLADGQAIAGANASTLVLAAAQGGKRIAARASYIDGAGYSESVTSVQSAIVGLSMTGGPGNDSLAGSSANDELIGLEGNDTLAGGMGLDTMIGGGGNDLYLVNAAGDVVQENPDEGTDTVQSSVSYTLLDNFETLTLIGSNPINGTGNALANFISGNGANNQLFGGDGNDTLNGGAGIDTLTGGAGNDFYQIVDLQDVLVESANGGIDGVQTTVTYTLLENFEILVLQGSSAINGTGNQAGNEIYGNTGNNYLRGLGGNDTFNAGAGRDTVEGGTGDDLYQLYDTLDVIIENPDEGVDTLRIAVTFSLPDNVEHLFMIGANQINGFGNALSNSLTGNAAPNRLEGRDGNDTLTGGRGVDTLLGGRGDDTYVVSDSLDLISELSDEGVDTVLSSTSFVLGPNLENLQLTGSFLLRGTGNAGDNQLTGNRSANKLFGEAGNDTLEGGGGADTLLGGSGDDTYIVNSGSVEISERAGEGTDTVFSAVSYTLGTGLEHLTLTGTAVVNGVGNSLNNQMNGNTGNNRLDGGSGNDTLSGGAGADTLIGGIGNDVFVMDASTIGPQMDVISDMNTIDRIDLRLIDAIASTSADDAFVFLGTNAFAAGQAGRVRYQSTQFENQPALLVQGDVNGDAQADFSVIVVGVTQLAATQFLL